MMRREIAYKLAGRRHQHENVLDTVHSHGDLRFSADPPGQVERALAVLQAMPHLSARLAPHDGMISLSYELAHFSLRSIEEHLLAQGFHLDDSFVAKMLRSLTHFREETQMRNAAMPQRLIKQSNQVYVKAYEHHQHGDHDDTPMELRDIK
jgi:hypothetical protein